MGYYWYTMGYYTMVLASHLTLQYFCISMLAEFRQGLSLLLISLSLLMSSLSCMWASMELMFIRDMTHMTCVYVSLSLVCGLVWSWRG